MRLYNVIGFKNHYSEGALSKTWKAQWPSYSTPLSGSGKNQTVNVVSTFHRFVLPEQLFPYLNLIWKQVSVDWIDRVVGQISTKNEIEGQKMW